MHLAYLQIFLRYLPIHCYNVAMISRTIAKHPIMANSSSLFNRTTHLPSSSNLIALGALQILHQLLRKTTRFWVQIGSQVGYSQGFVLFYHHHYSLHTIVPITDSSQYLHHTIFILTSQCLHHSKYIILPTLKYLLHTTTK